MKHLIPLLLVFFSLSFSKPANASHAVGVDLTYACLGGNQYRFFVNLYRDCNGVSAPTGVTVRISSASCGINSSQSLTLSGSQEVSQICGAEIPNTTCNGGSLPGIEQYTYSGTFTFPAECSDWVVSYSLCCRNNGITNLQSPSNQDLYVEAHINNTGGLCNSSPQYNALPTPYICVGQPFSYNHGAVDPDGNTLVYTLVDPLTGANSPIAHNGGFSATNPMSVSGAFGFNTTNGQMQFTPDIVQQGVLTVLIEEFDAGGNLIGSTMRDLQVVVINCSNNPPTASGVDGSGFNGGVAVYDYAVCSGNSFCFNVETEDQNPTDNTTVTWNNGIPGATFTVSGSPNQTGTFCWTPTINDIGTHFFTVTVQDDACPIPGINTYTYEVNITGSPDPPVVAGPDQTTCQGGNIILDATAGAGATFSWAPTTGLSNPNIANPSFTANADAIYTVTATYPSGCAQTDQTGIYVGADPTISINPTSLSICSGSSAALTANIQPGNTVLWSPGGETTTSVSVTPGSTTTYTATVTNPTSGCTSDATSTVTVSPPPPTEVCNNIYVTTSGVGSGLEPTDPTDLASALLMAQCNNSTIKLAIGTYNIDNPITDILGYTTIEGGFDPGNAWRKTSLPGATTINRTTANPEGPANNLRLVGIYMNSASYFRFQDITISVANANQPSMTTYGVHLTSCSDYYFTRTQIIAGNGSNGAPGTVGAIGTNGVGGATGIAGDNDDESNSGEGGSGGNGSGGAVGANGGTNPGGCCSPGNNGNNGVAGAGTHGGSGGGGGSGGEEDENGGRGGNGSGGAGGGNGGGGGDPGGTGNNGANGAAGTAGAIGATGPAGTHTAGFYVPGTNGGVGAGGNGGAGGAGGGGGGGQYCFICDDGAGSGGGGGGGGGQGGFGGTGGLGGGSSFAMYSVTNGANGFLQDCNFTSGTPGNGGVGGAGGAGGTGGASGPGNTYTSGEVGAGGNGGIGGQGGQGGQGGPGAPGISMNLYRTGTAPSTTNINFNLAVQPEVFVENKSCTNVDIDYSSAGSATWDLDLTSTPTTPTGATVTTQYTGLGRKDIDYGVDTYTGFANITLDGVTDPDINTSAMNIAVDTFVVCIGDNADFFTTATDFNVLNWDFGGAIAPNTYQGTFLAGLTFTTAGTYTITLTGSTDCCGPANPVELTLIVDDVPTPVVTGTMAMCQGENVILTATTTSDSIIWSPNIGLSTDIGAVVTFNPPTTTDYVVTAYSTYGHCSATDNFTVTLSDIDLSVSSTPTSCINDGSATVVTSNGSGNYDYEWNDPASQTTATATNLFSGNHQVVVTDQITGCMDSIFAFVDPGTSPIVYTSDLQHVTCSGENTGTATAAVVNGTAPITFTWINTDLTSLVSTGIGLDNVSSLQPGNYSVSITDNLGCTHNTDFVITEPDTVLYAIDVLITEPTCFGTGDGAITVTADGGSGGYTYQWDAAAVSQTGPTATGLDAGDYVLTVTDNNACTMDTTITLTVPGAPLVTNAGNNDTICGDTYTLAAIPTPGNSSGEWISFSGAGTAAFSSSTSGTSDVTVTGGFGTYTLDWREDNGAGCNATESVDITFIENPIADAGTNNAFCRLTGYTLNATASAGVGIWTFTGPGNVTFTPNANTPDAQVDVDLAGNYDFTWTESNAIGTFNCTDNNTVTISFTNLTFSASTSDALCGQCNGQVVIVSPTASAFAINAGVSQPAGTFTSLCAGPHTVTIESATGCSLDTIITIGAPTIPTIVASGTATICNGQSTPLGAQAFGGDGNYTYNWDNALGTTQNPSVSPTTTIEYMVTVTDGNTCTSTPDSVTITVDQAPDVSDAGGDQLACDTVDFVLLAGNTPLIGTGAWSTVNGGGIFSDITNPNSLVTSAPVGTNEYVWTISNGVCPVEINNVILETQSCAEELIIPNVFSPNGDGINDNFSINRPILDGSIYNRWGQLMYQYVGTKGYWDGRTSAGVEVLEGTYYFVLTIETSISTTQLVKGHVMLVR